MNGDRIPVWTGIVSHLCTCQWRRADDGAGFDMVRWEPACVLHRAGTVAEPPRR